MPSKKLTLLVDDLWIIRSVRKHTNGSTTTRYYETPAVWNTAPTKATIFTRFESAEAHMQMMRERDLKGVKGWADGSTEEFYVIGLHAEILHSPNGMPVHVRKGKGS